MKTQKKIDKETKKDFTFSVPQPSAVSICSVYPPVVFLSNPVIRFSGTMAAVIYMTFRSTTQARGTRTTSCLKRRPG